MRLLPSIVLALVAVALAVVKPGLVTGNVNPVADPTMCKSSSGEYFVFSTAPGIQIRTSPDRIASSPTPRQDYLGAGPTKAW